MLILAAQGLRADQHLPSFQRGWQPKTRKKYVFSNENAFVRKAGPEWQAFYLFTLGLFESLIVIDLSLFQD